MKRRLDQHVLCMLATSRADETFVVHRTRETQIVDPSLPFPSAPPFELRRTFDEELAKLANPLSAKMGTLGVVYWYQYTSSIHWHIVYGIDQQRYQYTNIFSPMMLIFSADCTHVAAILQSTIYTQPAIVGLANRVRLR